LLALEPPKVEEKKEEKKEEKQESEPANIQYQEPKRLGYRKPRQSKDVRIKFSAKGKDRVAKFSDQSDAEAAADLLASVQDESKKAGEKSGGRKQKESDLRKEARGNWNMRMGKRLQTLVSEAVKQGIIPEYDRNMTFLQLNQAIDKAQNSKMFQDRENAIKKIMKPKLVAAGYDVSEDEKEPKREPLPNPSELFSPTTANAVNKTINQTDEAKVQFSMQEDDPEDEYEDEDDENVEYGQHSEIDTTNVSSGQQVSLSNIMSQGPSHGRKTIPSGGLDTQQINQLMNHRRSYLATVPRDQIKNLAPIIESGKTASFIANLDPSHKDGSHWVAVVIIPKKARVLYFDSFGTPCPEDMRKQIKTLVKIAMPGEIPIFKENLIKVQNARTGNCGPFAMKFIEDTLDGKPFVKATPYDESLLGERQIRKYIAKFPKFTTLFGKKADQKVIDSKPFVILYVKIFSLPSIYRFWKKRSKSFPKAL